MATPNNFSVIKAFAILNSFRDSEGWLSSCELSRRANIPIASGYRLIQTMEKIGVIARGKRGQYRPGIQLLSIAHNIPLSEYLREAGGPILTPLAQSLNLTMHLGILQNSLVTYVGKYSSAGSFPVHTRVGTQLEAYCSGLGKVLLAGLNKAAVEKFIMDGDLVPLTPFTITSPLRLREELAAVRKHGYAIDDRESHVKIRCVAVPVHDNRGKTVAAISACDEVGRMTPSREIKIKLALFEAAAALQDVLYGQRIVRGRLSKDDDRGEAKSPLKFLNEEKGDMSSLLEAGPELAGFQPPNSMSIRARLGGTRN
ncbi:MAG TPA: IclR family transcriptional regulator [Rhizomicrobium sp.]|nr:IclR family transcriptional regulator [Rhizomicrobium sp.]